MVGARSITRTVTLQGQLVLRPYIRGNQGTESTWTGIEMVSAVSEAGSHTEETAAERHPRPGERGQVSLSEMVGRNC